MLGATPGQLGQALKELQVDSHRGVRIYNCLASMRKSFTCPMFLKTRSGWTSPGWMFTGFVLSYRVMVWWICVITNAGWEWKAAVLSLDNWCALRARGAFARARVFGSTSAPLPLAILSGPHEKPILPVQSIMSCCSLHFLYVFQYRLFQNHPRWPAQLTKLYWSELEPSSPISVMAEEEPELVLKWNTCWFKFLTVSYATPSLTWL